MGVWESEDDEWVLEGVNVLFEGVQEGAGGI